MSPVLKNLLIGVLTSVITGTAVWLWQRTKRARNLNRKSKFFNISHKDRCLLVMNHNPVRQYMMSHGDIYVLLDAARIVNELGGEVVVAPFDQALEGAGEMTEFCIGGPESNYRTKAHLERFLKDVHMRPFTDENESLAIIAGSDKFLREKGAKEYAILARIFPKPKRKPIFLICGQTARSNRGAMYYLEKNYEKLSKDTLSEKSFCLVIEISSPSIYGHKMVEMIKDITNTVII